MWIQWKMRADTIANSKEDEWSEYSIQIELFTKVKTEHSENNKNAKKIKKVCKKVLTKENGFGIMYKLLARGAPNLENDTERRKKERQLILRASDPSESLGCG